MGARESLYSANAYRILGLPGTATSGQVIRQKQQLETLAKLGQPSGLLARMFLLNSIPD